jgi:hypothetical protein
MEEGRRLRDDRRISGGAAGQFAGRLDVPLHLLFVLPTDATEAH